MCRVLKEEEEEEKARQIRTREGRAFHTPREARKGWDRVKVRGVSWALGRPLGLHGS